MLVLAAPEIAAVAQPGQFVMVKPSRGSDPLLRRPFSIFEILRDASGAPVGISLLNKRIGAGTSLLYDAEPGTHDRAVSGPLGRPFEAGRAARARRGWSRAASASRRSSRWPRRCSARHADDAVLRRAPRRRAVLRRAVRTARRARRARHRGRQPRHRGARHRAARRRARGGRAPDDRASGCMSADRRR